MPAYHQRYERQGSCCSLAAGIFKQAFYLVPGPCRLLLQLTSESNNGSFSYICKRAHPFIHHTIEVAINLPRSASFLVARSFQHSFDLPACYQIIRYQLPNQRPHDLTRKTIEKQGPDVPKRTRDVRLLSMARGPRRRAHAH